MTFAEFLRTRLKGKNLAEIARTIGVSRSVLNQWVNGRRLPSLASLGALERLAGCLNLTLEQLILKKVSNEVITTVTFEDRNKQYRLTIERVE